jgi:ketosteroid isomerase-like protein
MSEGNMRILRDAFEAWSTGDLDRVLETVDPEVVWINSGIIPDVGIEYRGHDGVRKFWSDWREGWNELVMVPERMVPSGDAVIVLVRFDGVAREGMQVSRRFAQVYTFRDGMLVHYQSYPSWDEAVEAVQSRDTSLAPSRVTDDR